MNVSITITRCRIPLAKPYNLSFANIEHYDTWFVEISSEDSFGIGEVTALPGYSWEDQESIENILQEFSARVDSFQNLDEIEDFAKGYLGEHPFAASPILTAVDSYRLGHDYFDGSPSSPVPLVALVYGDTPDSLEKSVRQALDAGYKSLKLKVGKDVEADINNTRKIFSIIGPDIKLRLDANQAFDLKFALKFCKFLETTDVELLEQPFHYKDWDSQIKLSKQTTVPLMLDESIWTAEDILRAAESGAAKLVKLKLFKHGGIANCIRLIRLAKSLSLQVVFGNGVQTELGCYLESRIYSDENLDMAGEMNGFLKAKNPTFDGKIAIEGDKMKVFDRSGIFRSNLLNDKDVIWQKRHTAVWR